MSDVVGGVVVIAMLAILLFCLSPLVVSGLAFWWNAIRDALEEFRR